MPSPQLRSLAECAGGCFWCWNGGQHECRILVLNLGRYHCLWNLDCRWHDRRWLPFGLGAHGTTYRHCGFDQPLSSNSRCQNRVDALPRWRLAEESRVAGATLDQIRNSASRKAAPAGTQIRCGHNREGVGGSDSYSLQVMKALSYSHVCSPAELPF
jgi:hypothetical protein